LRRLAGRHTNWSCSIHLVFHVSQLKQFIPNFTSVFSNLPVLTDFSQEDLQPEAIIERRLVKKGNSAITGDVARLI
jgi:hypothetical protein